MSENSQDGFEISILKTQTNPFLIFSFKFIDDYFSYIPHFFQVIVICFNPINGYLKRAMF